MNENYLVTKMDSYHNNQTKHCTHIYTSGLHRQLVVASTWMRDHQERPSVPTNSSHKLYGALSCSDNKNTEQQYWNRPKLYIYSLLWLIEACRVIEPNEN